MWTAATVAFCLATAFGVVACWWELVGIAAGFALLSAAKAIW